MSKLLTIDLDTHTITLPSAVYSFRSECPLSDKPVTKAAIPTYDDLFAENQKLKQEVERLTKGRDDRQKERDKEREKVRKLREENERLKSSVTNDDISVDLQRATVSEFRRLQEQAVKSVVTMRHIQALAEIVPCGGKCDEINRIKEKCENYLATFAD